MIVSSELNGILFGYHDSIGTFFCVITANVCRGDTSAKTNALLHPADISANGAQENIIARTHDPIRIARTHDPTRMVLHSIAHTHDPSQQCTHTHASMRPSWTDLALDPIGGG